MHIPATKPITKLEKLALDYLEHKCNSPRFAPIPDSIRDRIESLIAEGVKVPAIAAAFDVTAPAIYAMRKGSRAKIDAIKLVPKKEIDTEVSLDTPKKRFITLGINGVAITVAEEDVMRLIQLTSGRAPQ